MTARARAVKTWMAGDTHRLAYGGGRWHGDQRFSNALGDRGLAGVFAVVAA